MPPALGEGVAIFGAGVVTTRSHRPIAAGYPGGGGGADVAPGLDAYASNRSWYAAIALGVGPLAWAGVSRADVIP